MKQVTGKSLGCGIGLGLIAAGLAFFGNPRNMAICTACFIRDIAGAMQLHQAEAVQYVRPEIIGIVLGAMLMAIFAKEYQVTVGKAPMIRFVLGMVMMVGALIFLGCPLRMFIRMAAGDLNAYVAFPGFCLGVLTGNWALKRGFSLGRSGAASRSNGYVLPLVLVMLLILSIITTLMKVSEKGPGSIHAPLLISLIGGLLFGVISQRCRTCFAGSIRDLFLIKNVQLFSTIAAFFIVMLLYDLLTGGFQLSFAGQPVAHSQHLWNFLGMYVVGFAAVLAGGCPLRQLILAGQGSVDAAMTFLGLLVGAAVCHNLKLVSTAAVMAAEGAPAIAGGPGTAGKAALMICVAVLVLIGFGTGKETSSLGEGEK